jgi:hypothetical protein
MFRELMILCKSGWSLLRWDIKGSRAGALVWRCGLDHYIIIVLKDRIKCQMFFYSL